MSQNVRYDNWGERIIRFRVPLPFPLKWVNCYLIQGTKGYTVIDPGIHNEASKEAWQTFMKEQGLTFSNIEKIVLTHHHPDHYGLCGWLQQQSGAPVYISKAGADQVEWLWGESQPLSMKILELFEEHGMDPDNLIEMREHMEGFLKYVTPKPELTLLPSERYFVLGDELYEMIDTPGHAKGHISFYRKETTEIFCGDHMIARLTPNVSYLPGVDDNPLASYINSLNAVKTIEVSRAYSGHWHPFQQYGERANEIIEHHEQRLSWIKNELQKPCSAYQLCLSMFSPKLSIHQLRFAMAETLAHLIYLRHEDDIECVRQDGGNVWKLV